MRSKYQPFTAPDPPNPTDMKTTHLFNKAAILLPVFALMLGGCTKEQQEQLKPTAELQMEYAVIPFTVDSGGVAGELQLTLNFDGNALGQLLTDNGYSLSQLKEFRFTKAQLHLTTPATGNYDLLHSISLQLGLGSGQPVTVADLDPVPDGAQTLVMSLGDVNVAEIIRDSNVQLVVKAQLDGPMPAFSEHSLDLGAKVVVQP